MSVFHKNVIAGAAGQGGADAYQIDRSLRFNSADSAYLNRTPSSAGNRKTWTWSGWVKRSKSALQMLFNCDGGTSNSTFGSLSFLSTDEFQVTAYTSVWRQTTAVYRDYGAWYHIVVAFDSTQATASNRVRIYINGDEVTAFDTSNDPALNTDYAINQAQPHNLGKNYGGYGSFDGYLADVHFIDGVSGLTANDFGEYDDNNVWQPKAYSGSYGTNGFHLDFSDASSNAALGNDSSGNNNDWTVNNLSVASGAGNDSLIDTPTNYEASSGNNGGNYATLNPLANGGGTLANGNLNLSGPASSWGSRISTIGVSSGKWYFEATPLSGSSAQGIMFGVSLNTSPSSFLGSESTTYSYYGANGKKYNSNSSSAYGAVVADNDIVGVALDLDAGTLTFYKNNASQGTAFSGLPSGTYCLGVSCYGTATAAVNFGQRPFAYTPPTGFLPLVTTSLTDPTIADGSTAMDVALWTGNGSTKTISGLGFSPDLVWVKSRSNAISHFLYDTVRGFSNGNAYELRSNSTNAEGVPSTSSTGLTAFNSDGFSLGSDGGANTSSATYAAWTWDGGTTTATNNNGSIQSTVRANQSAGFSIVTYTGNGSSGTVGHGLNAAPEMIIAKDRDASTNWFVYHTGLGSNAILLNSTAAAFSPSPAGINAASSSTFTLGGARGETNTNGNDYVAYCFAPVAGYSAFGSYTGNGSTDGPFVYTGFRPAVIIFKNTDSANNWAIFDSARDSYNVVDNYLLPNTSGAEATASSIQVDFLSNGFKLRGSWQGMNESASTIVYAAWAESPFKYARAR